MMEESRRVSDKRKDRNAKQREKAAVGQRLRRGGGGVCCL